MKKKTEPNQSLQTISCSVTVAAEPLCVPPHEMSDLKRSAKNRMRPKAKILLSFYTYAALHIAAWWVYVNSNGNEAWNDFFQWVFLIIFFPLNLLNLVQMQTVWGTTNIFNARLIFDLFIDYALMSVISIHAFYLCYLAINRLVRTGWSHRGLELDEPKYKRSRTHKSPSK